MPLTAIRTIITEMVGGDKFEKVTTESGYISYAINNAVVDRSTFETRRLAFYENSKHRENRSDPGKK